VKESVLVYAAGSLRTALTDIARFFETKTGTPVRCEFGASGLLKDRILVGEAAQVFASANMEHPQTLVRAGKAGSVAVFARNRLCALVASALPSDFDLLAFMLDPAVKLGTSTPKADPGGDYAWEVFRRADAIKPGSFEVLSRKALQLTGGPNSSAPPRDRSVYGALVADGSADIFLTYCTNVMLAVKEQPQLRAVALPPALSVAAEYGVAVINGAPARASEFVDFLRGPEGQSVLRGFGFQ
jgi:ABC-type molybdate transport system substrate-binding protein